MTSTTPQKKRRLSNLFGRKKETSVSPVNPTAGHAPQPSVSTGNTSTGNVNMGDSAYASSDNPSSKRNSRADNIVPVENSGRYEGVSQDRNLALNKNTGDIIDDDTGDVVTTVTTTTTTTTTTVGKGGKKGTKVEVATQKDGQPAIAEAPGDGPSAMPPSQPQAQPSLSTQRSYSPPAHPPALTPGPSEQMPTPPTRNPNRKSREYEPVSPMRANFSYPSRTDVRTSEEPMPPPHMQHPAMQANGGVAAPNPAPKSTFENLKAAAVGLHGVGETLRGSLNHEIDSRFPRNNPDKAAAATAKNQAVLQTGNRELARLSERTNESSIVGPPAGEPTPTNSVYSPLPGAGDPMAPGPGGIPGGNYLAPQQGSDPGYYGQQGSGSDLGTTGSSEMSQVPPSFSPESSQPQKKGGFRKLIKRRPVEGS